jgi:plastocyanin
MKKYFLLPVLCFTFSFFNALEAQVVINEISYNPPESGNDTLEYIELFNAGAAEVNIGGWYFQDGVEDTLPSINLAPGAYFVSAISSSAMLNVFGINAHQWVSGALSNNGELITLVDAGGNVVDSVRFDDLDPWPVEPDGTGPSVELKDAGADNEDGANWQFSGGTTGVIINGFEVSGTPGAENSGGGTPGPDLTIDLANFAFVPNVAVVAVGDVVRWVNNEGHAHNVNGQQSTFPSNPASFFSGAPSSGPWQFEFEFAVPGTYHYQCDPHAGIGMTGTIYVYDPLAYNDFSLAELRLVNENGSALFDGVPTTIEGVVHGVNFQPSAYSFFVIDNTNTGINVFSFDAGTYTVQSGDFLRIQGTIDQFNGLLEIIPDTIIELGDGLPLNQPREITRVTEADESSYLLGYELGVDSVSNINSSGYTIYTTHDNGLDKVQIRVDTDAGIQIQPEDLLPGAWLQVFGVGTQFDNSFPFTGGYQILAIELYDIIDGVELLARDAISMSPNPAQESVRLVSPLMIQSIDVCSIDGKMISHRIVSASEFELNTSGWSEGLYTIRATTADGIWVSTLSIIK